MHPTRAAPSPPAPPAADEGLVDAEFTRLETLAHSGAVTWVHDNVLDMSCAEMRDALVRDCGRVAESLHRQHGHTSARVAPWRTVLDEEAPDGDARGVTGEWEKAWVRASSAKRAVRYLGFAKQIDVLTSEMVMGSRVRRPNEQIAVRMRITLGGIPFADSVVVHCSCTASPVAGVEVKPCCRVRVAYAVQFTRKHILGAAQIQAFATARAQPTLSSWLCEVVKLVEQGVAKAPGALGPDDTDVLSVATQQLAMGNISQLEYNELVQSDERFKSIVGANSNASSGGDGTDVDAGVDDGGGGSGSRVARAPRRLSGSPSQQRLALSPPPQQLLPATRRGGARVGAPRGNPLLDTFYRGASVDSLDTLWAQQVSGVAKRPQAETALSRCWRFFFCCLPSLFGSGGGGGARAEWSGASAALARAAGEADEQALASQRRGPQRLRYARATLDGSEEETLWDEDERSTSDLGIDVGWGLEADSENDDLTFEFDARGALRVSAAR